MVVERATWAVGRVGPTSGWSHAVDQATRRPSDYDLAMNEIVRISEHLAGLAGPAERLQWLGAHRLLGPVDLLVERGLVESDLASLARSLIQGRAVVSAGQIAEEQRVFKGMVAGGVRALALKGCLVAYACYPSPDQRWRSDLDVLVARSELDQARSVLQSLGYRQPVSVPGGTPTEQESWVRAHDGRHQAIDLHWALRNHPLLRDRLTFDEQWDESIELPLLAVGARGQGPIHALLNAAMHWYDNLYSEPRPCGWLLDIDLLWRQLDDQAIQELKAVASERELSGLLAGSLELTRIVYGTLIPEQVIRDLREAGQTQRPTRLISLEGNPLRSYLFSVACEPGAGRKLHRVRATLFPPRAHMRERFGAHSFFELARAYWRRAWRRIRPRP